MNKLYQLVLFLLNFGITHSQNLIPNPSFEVHTPVTVVGTGTHFEYLTSWLNPATIWPCGTPDYFIGNASGTLGAPDNYLGTQYAKNGVAYCGITTLDLYYPNFREYIETELISPLIAGNCYHFEMYLSLADRMKYTTSDIQIYFSDTLITGYANWDNLPYNPQISNSTIVPDTMNWKLFSGDYIAHGGEKYIIIGNFKNGLNTTPVTYNSASNYISSYFYIDDLSLVQSSCNFTNINEQLTAKAPSVFPNPAMSYCHVNSPAAGLFKFVLYDLTSKERLRITFNKSTDISLGNLPSGIYLYEITSETGLLEYGKLIID